MKSNEFFKALMAKENLSGVEVMALQAWEAGIREKLNFPLMKFSMWQDEISAFVKTLKDAGIKKFAYSVRSTSATENIACFFNAGWKLTGTLNDGLIFEF